MIGRKVGLCLVGLMDNIRTKRDAKIACVISQLLDIIRTIFKT